MKQFLILALTFCACQNHVDNSTTEYKERLTEDSERLEHNFKVIDFAGKMASLKLKQGYTPKQAKQYMDSILIANGVQPSTEK